MVSWVTHEHHCMVLFTDAHDLMIYGGCNTPVVKDFSVYNKKIIDKLIVHKYTVTFLLVQILVNFNKI